MRSQLLILTLISLAVSGCGKEVRRETALGSQQMNPAGNPQLRSTELRPGECGDRIGEPAYKRIERFSDVSQPQGVYDLVSFEAVGQSLSLGSGTAVDGVSVITATVKAGAVEFTQVCSDLAKMPNQSLDWSVSTPSGMTATDGTIKNETAFAQRIYGSAVLDASGQPRAAENSPNEMKATTCQSATAILNGEGCSPAKFYQMDPTSIGVLRTVTTKSATGAIVISKVFAQYVLVGAVTETPMPVPMPDTSTSPGSYEPSSQGTGNQGTGNQGSNANNGNNGNAKKVEKKKAEKKTEKKVEKKAGNNSNNSNNAGNGNNANNSNNSNNSGNGKKTEKKGTGNQGSNSPGTGNQGSITSGTGTVVEFDRVYVAAPVAATPTVVTTPVVVTAPVVVAPVEVVTSSDEAVVVKSKTKTKVKTVEKSESSSISGDSSMKTKSVTKVKSKTKTKMKKMN